MANDIKFIENAPQAKAIILSSEFATYSMADRYRALSQRTNVDFSAAIKLLDHLPVFIDGENHQKIRKLMAKQVSRTKENQFTASNEALSKLRQELFRPGSEFDLISEFCQPLWRSISSAIVPPNKDMLELIDAVPTLFSPFLSIRERAKINALIAAFLDVYCAHADDDLIHVCLASLGARPFVGSLGLSLWDVFQSNRDAKLSEISWPRMFPSSSLTYVDRIFATPGRCPHTFEKGDRVRCFTQSKAYTVEQNRSALFGFGAHTCLGKSISERVWVQVAAELSRVNLRVDCRSIAMSLYTDPFEMPGTITIRLA
jgi:hypothetical protein